MHAAIDFGTSYTKVVVMDKTRILKKRVFREHSIIPIKKFLRDDISRITTIYYTRSSKKLMEDSFLGSKVKKADELKSAYAGGLKLSKKKSGVVVSLGTGTAIIVNNKHVGGSPLGGGTIQGLCELLIGTDDLQDICSLARQGKIDKTSTLIKNIYPKGISSLQQNDIASYFSHLDYPNRGDIALGVITMMAESLGTLIGMITKSTRSKNIIFTGNLAKIKLITNIIQKRIQKITGKSIRFSIPRNPEYAVAIGMGMKQ